MKQKIFSFMLSALVILNFLAPQFASATDVATFDITIPTTLPITVSADGTVQTSTDFGITNNTNGVIYVENVQVDTLNSWSIVDFDTDFSKKKVNLKEFGLEINGDEVATNGTLDLGSKWSLAGENETISMAYDANVAVQGDDITEKIANVTFTLAWDTQPAPAFPYTEYYTYDYDSATAGYKLGLTEGFKAAVDGNGTFPDSAGNVWKAGDPLPDFGGTYDGKNVTTLYEMFKNCTGVTKLDLSLWDTSNVIRFNHLFGSCTSLKEINVSTWVTSNATGMSEIFYRCSALEYLDISSFDTAKVTHMGSMFNGCTSLKSLDVSNFVTRKCTYMSNMFYGCKALTSLDLGSFSTFNVTATSWMFGYCSSLESVNLTSFNTTNVTSVYKMFYSCPKLKELDLSSFAIDYEDGLYGFVEKCTALTTIYVKDSAVKDLLDAYVTCTVIVK